MAGSQPIFTFQGIAQHHLRGIPVARVGIVWPGRILHLMTASLPVSLACFLLVGNKWNGALIGNYLPYFAAGTAFYFYMHKRHTHLALGVILASLPFAILMLLSTRTWTMNMLGQNLAPYIMSGIICTFYAIFFLLNHFRLAWLGATFATVLGELTYPLYLLHDNLGTLGINALFHTSGRWMALLTVIAVALVASYAVQRWYEPAMRRWLTGIKKVLLPVPDGKQA